MKRMKHTKDVMPISSSASSMSAGIMVAVLSVGGGVSFCGSGPYYMVIRFSVKLLILQCYQWVTVSINLFSNYLFFFA